MSIRTERVASLIKEEIGGILIREFRGTSIGFTTVTDVTMTADLKIARVFFSVFGSEDVKKKTMAQLELQKAHIRQIVGSHVRMKFVPSLQFHLDETSDHAERINLLIKKIHDGSPP
jgi:ribosome-binding factor A